MNDFFFFFFSLCREVSFEALAGLFKSTKVQFSLSNYKYCCHSWKRNKIRQVSHFYYYYYINIIEILNVLCKIWFQPCLEWISKYTGALIYTKDYIIKILVINYYYTYCYCWNMTILFERIHIWHLCNLAKHYDKAMTL